jgi:hypothetical protein
MFRASAWPSLARAPRLCRYVRAGHPSGINQRISRLVWGCHHAPPSNSRTPSLSPSPPLFPSLSLSQHTHTHTLPPSHSLSLSRSLSPSLSLSLSLSFPHACQVIPAIAGEVAQLTVFQRSPPYVLPKIDYAFSGTQHARFLSVNPCIRKKEKGCNPARPVSPHSPTL